jgi:hypothetical protein
MARVRDLSGNYPNSLSGAAGFKDDNASGKGIIHRSEPVTASDTVDLPDGSTEALMVTTEGAYKVTYADGNIDSPYLAAGIWHPMQVKRVWSTGSVSTAGISAGY